MAGISQIVKAKQKQLDDVMRASVLRLGNRIIQDSPVDKGRFINNWMSAALNTAADLGAPVVDRDVIRAL